jgi:membrane associated rhomboid family serine protease
MKRLAYINPDIRKHIDYFMDIFSSSELTKMSILKIILKIILRKIPYVTLIFFIINMSLFDFKNNTHIFTDTKYGKDGKSHLDITLMDEYTPLALWYQLRQNLLHIDKDHLSGNMFNLIIIGSLVEMYFGNIKYLIIILSVMGLVTVLKYYTFRFFVTINKQARPQTFKGLGFSGVIFSLYGIFFIFALFAFQSDNYLISALFRTILVFFIGLTVVLEFKGDETKKIGNFAHVIGFLAGIIVMLLLDDNCI